MGGCPELAGEISDHVEGTVRAGVACDIEVVVVFEPGVPGSPAVGVAHIGTVDRSPKRTAMPGHRAQARRVHAARAASRAVTGQAAFRWSRSKRLSGPPDPRLLIGFATSLSWPARLMRRGVLAGRAGGPADGVDGASVRVEPCWQGAAAIEPGFVWVGERPDRGDADLIGVDDVPIPAVLCVGGVGAEFDDVAEVDERVQVEAPPAGALPPIRCGPRCWRCGCRARWSRPTRSRRVWDGAGSPRWCLARRGTGAGRAGCSRGLWSLRRPPLVPGGVRPLWHGSCRLVRS